MFIPMYTWQKLKGMLDLIVYGERLRGLVKNAKVIRALVRQVIFLIVSRMDLDIRGKMKQIPEVKILCTFCMNNVKK